jgi:hypothetical protein
MKVLLNSIFFEFLISIIFNLTIPPFIHAQEHQENPDHEENHEPADVHSEKHSEHHEFKPWRIGMGLGHSYLPAGTHQAEDVSFIILPTIGLDIQFWFNQRFALALKNELELISYVVETSDGNEIEREYPIISVLVAMYKLKNGLVFYLGAGIEYEKNKNFFIGKAGIEYELHLGRHWDVTPEFYYFNKDADFGGVGLSITFGKRF